jgi:hypothetical protein
MTTPNRRQAPGVPLDDDADAIATYRGEIARPCRGTLPVHGVRPGEQGESDGSKDKAETAHAEDSRNVTDLRALYGNN